MVVTRVGVAERGQRRIAARPERLFPRSRQYRQRGPARVHRLGDRGVWFGFVAGDRIELLAQPLFGQQRLQFGGRARPVAAAQRRIEPAARRPVARFGRGGMIQDISNRLLKDFADCLQQKIEAPRAAEPNPVDAVLAATPEGAAAAPATAKPVGGFSLFFRALLDRLRRVFGRG